MHCNQTAYLFKSGKNWFWVRAIVIKISTHLSTTPHRSRKKRELTRAVETFKKGNGGGIEAQ